LNKEELIDWLGGPRQFQMVASSTDVTDNHILAVADLLEVSFHRQKEVGFRASWMLERIMAQKPAEFAPYVGQFLGLLPAQKNLSAMRHYGKIVALLTDKKADPIYKSLLPQLDFEPVIATLFSWLIEDVTPVAVKVHCMQSLANLSPRYSWIKAELLETMDYLIDKESYAFFARVKMIRQQFKRAEK
jgi:hypothetical protein